MSTENSIIPNVNKIVVLRANALGDLIFILPALKALRDTYPKAEITYLGNSWHKTFLRDRKEIVDDVIVIPKFNGIPNETDTIENTVEVARFFNK